MLRSVVIALGSNLGDRGRNLRAAIRELGSVMTVVRVSGVHETDPVGAPAGSPRFLNMVVAGFTHLDPEQLLAAMQQIESRQGRRRSVTNAPRTIDLDLILYGATMRRSRALTLPHPRYRERRFVLDPLGELALPWIDPETLERLGDLSSAAASGGSVPRRG